MPKPKPRYTSPNTTANIIRAHVIENLQKYKDFPPQEISYRIRKALPNINRANIRQVVRRLRLSGILPESPSDYSINKATSSLRDVRKEFGEEKSKNTVRRIIKQLRDLGVEDGKIIPRVILTALPEGINLDERTVANILSALRLEKELGPLSESSISAIRRMAAKKTKRTMREKVLENKTSYGYKYAAIRAFIERSLNIG